MVVGVLNRGVEHRQLAPLARDPIPALAHGLQADEGGPAQDAEQERGEGQLDQRPQRGALGVEAHARRLLDLAPHRLGLATGLIGREPPPRAVERSPA